MRFVILIKIINKARRFTTGAKSSFVFELITKEFARLAPKIASSNKRPFAWVAKALSVQINKEKRKTTLIK